MSSHHNCFAEKLICSHNYTTFTTAAVPRSVQTFLLVHYFSIQCLCLGKVLVFAGNSFAGHLFPISNIIISDTREAQGASFIGEISPLGSLPPLFTILNIPNQEFRHNENSYNTIQRQGRCCAVTSHRLNSSNLSRIWIMRPGEEGNIFHRNPAPVVKFQFSNLSSILSTEVKFNLAK